MSDIVKRLRQWDENSQFGKALLVEAAGEIERLRKDAARLDFLDGLNARLNTAWGTTYKWELVINHNVNRLLLSDMKVDLNDMAANGLKSCRDAIDAAMVRVSDLRPEGVKTEGLDPKDASAVGVAETPFSPSSISQEQEKGV
ncbi:hypothetical protein [Microvirga mediterraneensis]|jgi:hypothetical protein|uniref:Uncharacterized protein n=1 Tax=Microvirga mediterraneensis TaxID=2754695 RepID=A0A838BPA1_9HYPH|nr:hypothetical protein [Microvirga mediterraneensis]MBA1156889.1 hypothetical protein [Microvirga mediterraneensis]MBA1157808.1 hypothetical protein [Microvirga mediterraneensis]